MVCLNPTRVAASSWNLVQTYTVSHTYTLQSSASPTIRVLQFPTRLRPFCCASITVIALMGGRMAPFTRHATSRPGWRDLYHTTTDDHDTEQGHFWGTRAGQSGVALCD